MEELLELKQLLQHGEIDDALALIEELEEMGRKAIARNIRSYAKVLLLHLIKQHVEQRTTKSWDASIRNALREINDINARPKGRGVYLDDEELQEVLLSAVAPAVEQAALEVAGGMYSVREIEQRVSRVGLEGQALLMIKGL